MTMALRGTLVIKMLIFVIFISALIYFSRRVGDLKTADDTKSPTNDHPAKSQADIVAKNVISLDIYYEALCPDSKNFIVRQLGPTYEKLHEIIDISLIPYGKAKSKKMEDGSETAYRFDCQHGPPECQANKFHACAVKQLDSKISVPLVVCLMEHNYDTKNGLVKCANKLGINYSDIDFCGESKEGDHLLYIFGELTHDLSPSVYFIPTVEIEKSQDRFRKSLRDLHGEICEEYKNKFGTPYSKCQAP